LSANQGNSFLRALVEAARTNVAVTIDGGVDTETGSGNQLASCGVGQIELLGHCVVKLTTHEVL